MNEINSEIGLTAFLNDGVTASEHGKDEAQIIKEQQL